MKKNLGDYVLALRTEHSFPMLNGLVGLALTYEVADKHLNIEIEGFIPCDGDEVSIPTKNSKLISFLSTNNTAFHSVGVINETADAAFKELTEFWNSVETFAITQTMNVQDKEGNTVGTNVVTTSGLPKNFMLVMGDVVMNYGAIGKADFVMGDDYPYTSLQDTALFERAITKKEE